MTGSRATCEEPDRLGRLDVAGHDGLQDRRLAVVELVVVVSRGHLTGSSERFYLGCPDARQRRRAGDSRVRVCSTPSRVAGRHSSSVSALMKASWGISTRPIDFMRFLPSFCFSRSLRLRVMSPP